MILQTLLIAKPWWSWCLGRYLRISQVVHFQCKVNRLLPHWINLLMREDPGTIDWETCLQQAAFSMVDLNADSRSSKAYKFSTHGALQDVTQTWSAILFMLISHLRFHWVLVLGINNKRMQCFIGQTEMNHVIQKYLGINEEKSQAYFSYKLAQRLESIT